MFKKNNTQEQTKLSPFKRITPTLVGIRKKNREASRKVDPTEVAAAASSMPRYSSQKASKQLSNHYIPLKHDSSLPWNGKG